MTLGGAAVLLGSRAFQREPKPDPLELPLQPVRRSGFALGTHVSMQVWHAQVSVGQSALDAAFSELETVEQAMSLYRDNSELTRLNRSGVLEHPHPYLYEVLKFSLQLSEQSNGAFDVTVQPLWNTYVKAARRHGLPSAAEIEAAKKLTGWQDVELSLDRVRFKRPGMAITLNGVAQGYAADRALEALRRFDIRQALIDTGEFGALDRKPGAAYWPVGIQHPRDPNALLTTAGLEGQCLATSGDYETFFTPDFSANHIFDPKTGSSPRDFSSVSIASPKGLWADGLSTALFVLGREKGAELLKEYPGSSALFVDKQVKMNETPGFPEV